VINSTSAFQCLKALVQADFSVLMKNKRSLIISLLVPIFLLVAWNNKGTLSAFGGKVFVLAIVTTIGILSLSIFGYALSVAKDRDNGVFQRLRVTPAPKWTIVTSRLLVQEISNLIVAIIVLVVGSRMYHVSLSVEEYIFALLISILAGAVFLSIGQTIVGLVKSSETVNATARLVYIALMLFGLLGLSGALGKTIEAIAKWSPFGAVIRIYEGIPHLGTWTAHTSLALLVCFGYIVVFSFIGIKCFRWDSR
jgi:ABC-2 type transport system permease protein